MHEEHTEGGVQNDIALHVAEKSDSCKHRIPRISFGSSSSPAETAPIMIPACGMMKRPTKAGARNSRNPSSKSSQKECTSMC